MKRKGEISELLDKLAFWRPERPALLVVISVYDLINCLTMCNRL
jgi:hypothetical protein